MASSNPAFLSAFLNLGTSTAVDETTSSALKKFTCMLFWDKVSHSVNAARHDLFRLGKFGEDSLPPNKDALNLHTLRANYVSYIWRRCLQQLINAPDFTECGWKIDDGGKLAIEWLSSPAGIDALVENAKCCCKTGCSTRRCTCVKNELKCTELCKCNGCSNTSAVEEEDEDAYDDVFDASDTDATSEEDDSEKEDH